jgi:hypothetical protein
MLILAQDWRVFHTLIICVHVAEVELSVEDVHFGEMAVSS